MALAGIIWAVRRHEAQASSSEVEFKTSPVTRGDVTQIVTANGSLNAVQRVEVGSQISGSLTAVNVDYNSHVKAGEVIAQIDPATYERAKRQAEAELASAQAAEELAQLNFDRGKDLFGLKYMSTSDFDQLRVDLAQAKATTKTRQAALESAQVDLDRTTIHAPIDGVVITRQVEPGQTVAAAMTTPTLFTIANDLHKMQIEAAVAEADIGGVLEGQKVQFTVDAFPGRLFEGSVRQVRYAPSTNQNVVTYTSVVDVDNKDLKLRPGMTANARFIIAERTNVLKIPLAAMRFRPPPGVTVLGDAPKLPMSAQAPSSEPKTGMVYLKEQPAPNAPQGPVALRAVPVKLGISDGSSVEVIEGLKENDEVVSGTVATAMGQGLRNPFSPFPGPPRR